MAELLISNKDTPNFSRYDIISVKDDGFQWGKYECWDDFVVVAISNKRATELNYLVEPEYYIDPNSGLLRIAYNRKYFYEYDKILPKSEIDKIISSNWYVPIIDINDLGVKVWQQ